MQLLLELTVKMFDIACPELKSVYSIPNPYRRRLLIHYYVIRDHSVYSHSQWDTALQCNAISHWLGAYTDWYLRHLWEKMCKTNFFISVGAAMRACQRVSSPSKPSKPQVTIWEWRSKLNRSDTNWRHVFLDLDSLTSQWLLLSYNRNFSGGGILRASSFAAAIDYHRQRFGHLMASQFPHYWPFVRGIHRSSVDPPLKGPV